MQLSSIKFSLVHKPLFLYQMKSGYCGRPTTEFEQIYLQKYLLLSYLLVTSSPLHGGHGCRIIVLAGVGGQHRYESHVKLQYKPQNGNKQKKMNTECVNYYFYFETKQTKQIGSLHIQTTSYNILFFSIYSRDTATCLCT